eukprot:COSAG02_NODE_1372_length_13018_cov_5.358155_7_plen_210_part_00
MRHHSEYSRLSCRRYLRTRCPARDGKQVNVHRTIHNYARGLTEGKGGNGEERGGRRMGVGLRQARGGRRSGARTFAREGVGDHFAASELKGETGDVGPAHGIEFDAVVESRGDCFRVIPLERDVLADSDVVMTIYRVRDFIPRDVAIQRVLEVARVPSARSSADAVGDFRDADVDGPRAVVICGECVRGRRDAAGLHHVEGCTKGAGGV